MDKAIIIVKSETSNERAGEVKTVGTTKEKGGGKL